MKAEQIDQALEQKFLIEDARIVFWHDPNSEFVDYVTDGLEGELAGVQVLDVAQVGAFSVKLRLELEDREGKYLVYSQGERSPADEDWLLDIRLYSAQFHADVASLWLQELGLSSLNLRDHLQERAAFLRNQERRRKLKRLIVAGDGESEIDLKMMAVLVGSPLASPFEVLRHLAHGHEDSEGFDLSTTPEAILAFVKNGLLESFWAVMRDEFAYEAESPTLAGLLRRLFVSELCHQVGDESLLSSIAHHQLPRAGRQNAVVFLTQWRDSKGSESSYDAAAGAVAEEQGVAEVLAGIELETLREVYTFWEAEKRILATLRDQLLQDAHSVDRALVKEIASDRRAGHWLADPRPGQQDRVAIAKAYGAIVAASELFELSRSHRKALSFETPDALLAAYTKDLYRFDRLYRTFCTAARPALQQGWDILKALTDEVAAVYDQHFLQPLGVEWSRLLDAGFLGTWSADGLRPQQGFYANHVKPLLAESERRRAYVIISDAFRYEAATELTEALNGVYRMDADLSAMLGVLPSYTALGMASLLPHKTLGYNPKGEVLVDGRPVAGTEARSKQLQTVQGMACQAKDLRVMKKAEARAFIQDKRVVYIYHNVIDAMGDSASTENTTFEAVTKCIEELTDLVEFCLNTLNAGQVWVTADHGFLYQQEAPGETDKSKLSQKPAHAVKVKKRYVIGQDLGSSPEAHHGTIEATAGAEGDMEFWVPRAANRFHFTGGARFVHGGAMPQEVVVPLVSVTHIRGKKKEASRSAKVGVQVLGANHKITTPQYRFEIIQTEAVGERRKPVTLTAAVYEGHEKVSSVETVTFDSTSDSIEDRKKSVRLELRTGTFDKTTSYRLVLRDVESDAEVQTVTVVIDRSFDDDF